MVNDKLKWSKAIPRKIPGLAHVPPLGGRRPARAGKGSQGSWIQGRGYSSVLESWNWMARARAFLPQSKELGSSSSSILR